MPIFNAFDEVRVCLDSLARNTTRRCRLILVDDASPDPRIAALLADFASTHHNVELITHDRNKGFIAASNAGFAMAGGDDVVILNSDTEVPPRWLEQLCNSGADPRVGTVTALSNNAGAFSAPLRGTHNELVGPIEVVGRAVAQGASYTAPDVPTGHGFCMWIRREVLDETDGFDGHTFGRGYCEENDLCLRAAKAGWRNVLADGLLVRHGGSASFGAAKARQLAVNRALLDRRHPEYNDLVRAFLDDEAVNEACAQVGVALEARGAGVRPRILFVLHGGGGGTPQTNRDLMVQLAERYDPMLLRSDGSTLTLSDGLTGETIETAELPSEIGPLTERDPHYAAAVRRILHTHAIELLHVRHLQGHADDLITEAYALDIPIVLSLHDYYTVCPSTQLIDDNDRFCGGVCSAGQGECRTPPGFEELPHLKHGFVRPWRARHRRLLEHVDAFVTTSSSARRHLIDSFPEIGRHLFLIEHGRDFPTGASVAAPPTRGEPIRLLVPGVIGVHKGAQFIADLAERDTEGRLEFHLLGTMTRFVTVEGLIDHGPYDRDDFAARAAEIAPAATLVTSIWAETYSHTVSESWAAGIPVIGSQLGAVGERLERHGGGWTIDTDDPDAAYARILALMDDLDGWETARADAHPGHVRSTVEMGDDYRALYARVLAGRRALVAR